MKKGKKYITNRCYLTYYVVGQYVSPNASLQKAIYNEQTGYYYFTFD